MEKKDQIRFIKEMSKNITDEIIKNIKNGKIPDNWNGYELRQLLSDLFKADPRFKMTGERLKEYKNTVN